MSDINRQRIGKTKNEVVKWIKEQPYFTSSTKRSCGSNGLDEMAMKMVVQMVEDAKAAEYKTIKLQAKPHLLYKPGLNTPNPEANQNFRVLDRVVVVNDSFSVPIGYKGTITAVHTITDPNPVRLESVRKTDVLYEILFDKAFDEGNTVEIVAEKRFFNVPPIHLLNITQGLKTYNITKPAESVHQVVADDRKNIWEQLKKSNQDKKLVKSKPNTVMPNVPKDVNVSSEISVDESDVLRKLLKIQLNKQPVPPVMQNSSYENSTKINVNDLFRVDSANPPKPPKNWHSQKTNQSNMFPTTTEVNHNTNHHFYPTQTTKPNYIHHPRPNSAAHRSPIHNDVNFTLNNQILPPQGPKGPPHFGKYPPGHHGAFIPLQAARSITKSYPKESDNIMPKLKVEHSKTDISTNQQKEARGELNSETNKYKKNQTRKRSSKVRVVV